MIHGGSLRETEYGAAKFKLRKPRNGDKSRDILRRQARKMRLVKKGWC